MIKTNSNIKDNLCKDKAWNFLGKMAFLITDGLLGLGFLILLLILRYGYAPYGFFKKIGICGPTPWPFIGTFLEYRKVRHR